MQDMMALIITSGLEKVFLQLAMRYNVAQLLKEPTGSSRKYELDKNYTEPERFADVVRGPVDVLRTHHGILVRAELQAQAMLTCSRCLGDYTYSSDLSIEEEFFSAVDIQTGQTRPALEDAEEGSLLDSNHELDLERTSREYFLTDMPMKPLCHRDCLGLCQMCGMNLNLESCDCDNMPKALSWGVLSNLLKQSQGTTLRRTTDVRI